MDQSYITAFDIEESSWEDINALSGAKDANQMVFEESQKEFSLPSQMVQNTWLMNQTSQNQFPQATFPQASTSSGVNTNMHLHANDISSVQPRPSGALSISNNEIEITRTAQNRGQTKKEIDKAYRNRVKEKKIKMGDNICHLSNENEKLKSENEYLIQVTSTTNKSSQLATAEKKELEKDIDKLSREIKSLQICVDSYSRRLVKSNYDDHQSELIELKNKISILKQNSNRNEWMREKPQLETEIANLEHQNKVLKLKVEVLSNTNTDRA